MTKPQAKRALDAILGPLNSVSYRPGRIATVEQFSESWRREVLGKQEPSSIRSANSHLRCYVRPFLGKVKLHELGVETQQGFVTRVGNKVSRKTTLNVLATLSILFQRCSKTFLVVPEVLGLLTDERRAMKKRSFNGPHIRAVSRAVGLFPTTSCKDSDINKIRW